MRNMYNEKYIFKVNFNIVGFFFLNCYWYIFVSNDGFYVLS